MFATKNSSQALNVKLDCTIMKQVMEEEMLGKINWMEAALMTQDFWFLSPVPSS